MTALAHYCTYFDHRYLTRGLALHASMRRHCQPFRLWVLCLSDECYAALTSLALSDVVALRLEELERHDPALHAVKSNRSTFEYYMTCTAPLMAWLFASRPEISVLTYLDADLFFFHNPNCLLEEFRNFSTLITPHNFSGRNLENEFDRKAGKYQVSWVSFRRDADGLACLRWWRQSCVEWCYDRLEENRWLDQKYLEQFPEKFARVQVTQHPGVNVGPSNLDQYRVSARANKRPMVNEVPVIFFHFSGLRRVAPFLWRTMHPHFGAPLNWKVRHLFYAPYFAELSAADRILRRLCPLSFSPPLQYKISRKVGKGIYPTLREIVRLMVRPGGIWRVGNITL